MESPPPIGDPGRAATHIGPGLPPPTTWPSDLAISEHDSTDFTIRAASVRGVLHRYHNGDPRQDVYAIAQRPSDGTIAAVVCDGVGSTSRAHLAADLAATTALGSYLEGDTWESAIHRANSLLNESFTQAAGATTIVAVAVQRCPEGLWVDGASVGDSELQQLRESRWVRILPPPQSNPQVGAGEVATGGTRALPSSALRVRTWSGAVDEAPIFLMTDGVGLPLEMSPLVRRTLAQWWSTPVSGLEFARQVGFAKATFVDDRTVVGLWPKQPPDTQPLVSDR